MKSGKMRKYAQAAQLALVSPSRCKITRLTLDGWFLNNVLIMNDLIFSGITARHYEALHR